jgi:hypothetical protein
MMTPRHSDYFEIIRSMMPRVDMQLSQSAHRPQPGLPSAVIGFDEIIGVLPDEVAGAGQWLLDHSWVGRCAVGAHLGRV